VFWLVTTAESVKSGKAGPSGSAALLEPERWSIPFTFTHCSLSRTTTSDTTTQLTAYTVLENQQISLNCTRLSTPQIPTLSPFVFFFPFRFFFFLFLLLITTVVNGVCTDIQQGSLPLRFEFNDWLQLPSS
jgi:hypothetical protein